MDRSLTAASFVGQLHEAIVDDAAYAAMPALMAEYVGGRAGLVLRFLPDGALADFRWSYYTDELVADIQRRHPDGRDVWTAAGLAGPRNTVEALDTRVPEDVYRRSGLWNDVFRPHGDDTGHSMGVVLEAQGARIVVACHRAFGAGAFTSREEARLASISADLHRVHLAREMLSQRDGTIAALERLLAGSGVMALLVGHDLALVQASPRARMLFNSECGLSVRAGRLVMQDQRLQERLREAVNRTICSVPTAQAAFACRGPDGHNLRLMVVPVGDTQAGHCVIMIEDEGQDPARIRAWLSGLHRVTAAECDVAEALLAGCTAEEVAARRDVSLTTVRTQIRALLEKTGQRNMAQLVGYIARLH